MNDKLTIFEFFAEIFWAKINILPLKIDKKVSKNDFDNKVSGVQFFEKNPLLLSVDMEK